MGEYNRKELIDFWQGRFGDAANWMNLAGEYHHRHSRRESLHDQEVDQALSYLAAQLAEDNYEVVMLLSDLELAASTYVSGTDAEAQQLVRAAQMHGLTRLMNGHKGLGELSVKQEQSA